MRRLAFALFLVGTFGGTLASAQTIIITHAPAGGAIEVFFNNASVGTATADDEGQGTMTFGIPPQVSEVDVRVSTERCGETRRVLLVERGITAAPPTGPCDRRDFPDVFVVQRVTTFVVDFTNAVPSVHLRQGVVPDSWLSDQGGTTSTGKSRFAPAPKGLMVSGGIGFSNATDWETAACGTNTPTCTSTAVTRALVGTASFWLTPYMGAEATYFQPSDTGASGNGTDYTFTSSRKLQVAMLGGVVGGAVGGVRIYGRGGATYHRATLTTTETITNTGTQNLEFKTAGWSWYAGGGVELWLKSFVAFYVDGAVLQLRGGGVGGADGSMEETVITATVGARIHLWK
jgi:hypothetical protein